MTDDYSDAEDAGENSSWPAFVDLFSATSLLFITLVAVFIYMLAAQRGRNTTTRDQILSRLSAASKNATLFGIDSTDRQFIRIILREQATFPVRQYTWSALQPEGRAALTSIGQVLTDSSLVGLYREVRVLGNADQNATGSTEFTNWELSAARAAVVARYLVSQAHVNPCKISATGRGSFFPFKFTGSSLERSNSRSMQENRRIEVQVVPRLARADDAVGDGCYPDGDGTVSPISIVPAKPSGPASKALITAPFTSDTAETRAPT